MVAAGRTIGEAARHLPDAIDSWIQGAEGAGIPVPPPSRAEDDYSGRFLLRVPKSLHRKLADRALAEGSSLNSYCQMLLATGVESRATVRQTAAFAAPFVTFVEPKFPATHRIAEEPGALKWMTTMIRFSSSEPGQLTRGESEERSDYALPV